MCCLLKLSCVICSLDKVKLQHTPIIKNQHFKNNSRGTQNLKHLNQAKMIPKEMYEKYKCLCF